MVLHFSPEYLPEENLEGLWDRRLESSGLSLPFLVKIGGLSGVSVVKPVVKAAHMYKQES